MKFKKAFMLCATALCGVAVLASCNNSEVANSVPVEESVTLPTSLELQDGSIATYGSIRLFVESVEEAGLDNGGYLVSATIKLTNTSSSKVAVKAKEFKLYNGTTLIPNAVFADYSEDQDLVMTDVDLELGANMDDYISFDALDTNGTSSNTYYVTFKLGDCLVKVKCKL